MKCGIVMEQAGEGCDYTIGCGMRFETFDADTPEAAIAEARRRLQSDDESGLLWGDSDSDECNLKSATLVVIAAELPVAKWYSDLVAAKAQRERVVADATERAQLAHLLAKHGRPT